MADSLCDSYVIYRSHIQRTAIRNICTKFHQARFKTGRLVCVSTDGHWYKRTPGQTDRASLIPLMMPIKNLICRCLLKCVENSQTYIFSANLVVFWENKLHGFLIFLSPTQPNVSHFLSLVIIILYTLYRRFISIPNISN